MYLFILYPSLQICNPIRTPPWDDVFVDQNNVKVKARNSKK